MKKDRNCNIPYPIYPNYVPNMMPINNIPNVPMDFEQQINMINNKLNNLERRISNLESNNNYNNGYQMM